MTTNGSMSVLLSSLKGDDRGLTDLFAELVERCRLRFIVFECLRGSVAKNCLSSWMLPRNSK